MAVAGASPPQLPFERTGETRSRRNRPRVRNWRVRIDRRRSVYLWTEARRGGLFESSPCVGSGAIWC